MYDYSIPSSQFTSDMLAPSSIHSRHVSQTKFSNQIIKLQLSPPFINPVFIFHLCFYDSYFLVLETSGKIILCLILHGSIGINFSTCLVFFFFVCCFFCLFVCLFVFCVFVTHGSPLITSSFCACMLPLSCKGSYVLVASDICVTCNRFLKRQI